MASHILELQVKRRPHRFDISGAHYGDAVVAIGVPQICQFPCPALVQARHWFRSERGIVRQYVWQSFGRFIARACQWGPNFRAKSAS